MASGCDTEFSPSKQTEAQEDENLFTRLVLRVHAANLPSHGILRSPPSTYAKITSITGRTSRSGPYYNDDDSVSAATMVWGETEIIPKNRHPQWTTTFEIDYEYGSECYFSVNVYRAKGKDEEDPMSYGTATCEVGDILGSKNRTKVKRLPRGGVVFCRLEAVNRSNNNLIARFQFQARINCNRRSILSKLKRPPNTRFQISKRHPNAHRNAWLVVYRSGPVNESFEPRWDPGEIDLEALCNGDLDRPLRLRVLLDKSKQVCLGQCETTLRMILGTQSSESSINGFNIFKSIENQVVVGRLDVPLAQVVDLKLEQEVMIENFEMINDDNNSAVLSRSPTASSATFYDYIENGWFLDFMVAIDFTSSNGDPRIPGTLHDQATESLNDYEECIQGIGGELGRYSESCTIWGFGAKYDGVTRHLFQLGSSTCHGSVDGILEAYRSVFQSDLIMSGPTLFDQVIQAAATRANKSKVAGALRYSVLLVLTDGVSQDFEETRRQLNVYSSEPLSIIFVGLGRSDFSALRQLTSGDYEHRSISSFVEYREHQHYLKSLGDAALGSLPRQFVEYMAMNNIQP